MPRIPILRGALIFPEIAQMKRQTIVVASFLGVIWLIAGTQASGCQSEKELRGLPNFGRVTDKLYRGGQPTSDGFKELHATDVRIIINFREDRAATANEKREVESLGMKYVGIPWSANHEPSSAQIGYLFIAVAVLIVRGHDHRLPHCG
jgi:hypothetical protein